MNEKELLLRDETNAALRNWREEEKTALELLKVAGDLRFDKSIELVIFRRNIYDGRASEILNNHLFAQNYVQQPLSVDLSLELANAIAAIADLKPAKLDIGKLGAEWLEQKEQYKSLGDFVHDKLKDNIASTNEGLQSKDVVLYGFGRIGRIAARIIIGSTGKGEQLRLKAIVLRQKMKSRKEEAHKRAALLEEDSVHGKFRGTISVSEDGEELIINGNRVQLIYAGSPTEIDYTSYGINNALVIDNTGVWRNKEQLSVHLRPGIDQVCLSAPGDGIPNVVFGVNQQSIDLENDRIFCAASCTTNAIAPVLKIVNDSLGIERGHIETIHAYTSDQNLLDNFHKKPRRGRGAAVNMVLTSTGAATAVNIVMPELEGKLTGNSVRVPTPNVSLAILNLTINNPTTIATLNQLMKDASIHGDLIEQIHYSDSTEFVSTQAVGMTTTSIFDAPSTIVSPDGKNITIYAWYDNEFGYTSQLVRLAKYAAKVRRFSYY